MATCARDRLRPVCPTRVLAGSGAASDARVAALRALGRPGGEHRIVAVDAQASSAVAAAERAGEADLAAGTGPMRARVHDLVVTARSLERAAEVVRCAGLAHREARALAELGLVQSSAVVAARAHDPVVRAVRLDDSLRMLPGVPVWSRACI